MGSYLLDRNEEILSEKVRETVANHLFRKSGQIDDWMWQRTREVTRWSASFVVFEGVEALTRGTGDVERARRDLNEYLASVLGHYQTYESLFVTDAQGKILASTRDEQWEDWANGLLARPEAAKAGVVSPLHRSPFLGRPTLLAPNAIQDRNDRNGGYLAATVPARVAYRALDEARRRLLIVGLSALLIVLLVSFFAARNLLRPILLLSEGARRLSRGETDVSLPVAGSDELTDLTRTFNDMSARM